MNADLMIAELAQLKRRVEALERVAFAAPDSYVEGWGAAARLVGVHVITCRRRFREGVFPQPCRQTTIARSTGEVTKPTWRRADLVAYAEGR
jgi:hypothetical protein